MSITSMSLTHHTLHMKKRKAVKIHDQHDGAAATAVVMFKPGGAEGRFGVNFL